MTEGRFLDGYFAKRVLNGEMPERGYPASPLPSVPDGARMRIRSGFMASRSDKPTPPVSSADLLVVRLAGPAALLIGAAIAWMMGV